MENKDLIIKIMQASNHYQVYKAVVQKLINNEEQLPSLPSITLKIRRALKDPNITIDVISKLVRLDPSLSALLMKYAANPMYLRPVPPKTINSILSMIGLPALDNIVMAHSVKSLFVVKNLKLKSLFKETWGRMIYKAAISQFLANKLGLRPAEEAITASILTEVGTLAVLSAFSTDIHIPDKKTYFQLCKQYSKSLSNILMTKWGLDAFLVEITNSTGKWGLKHTNELSMIDIINLAIYSTVQHQCPNNDLPSIEKLSSFQKLPPSLNQLDDNNQLLIVKDNLDVIDRIVKSIC